MSEMPDGSPSWQVLDVPPAPRRLSSPAAVGLVMLLTALSVAVASVAVQAVTGSAPFSMTLLGVVLHPDRPRQEEPGAESAADVVVEARLTREGGEAA